MVSQRQKSARKRFKEANPDLVPKPEPPPSTGPSAKKKKKKWKPWKTLKGGVGKPRTGGGGGGGYGKRTPNPKKHPLRVPGKKPGEGCFICQSQDHIAKFCPKKSEWEKNKICLLCRHRGHSLKNCPNKGEVNDKKLCYNCGEVGHSLSTCPQPLQHGGTKFANCFICNGQGHLSKNCPQNTHGVYPKGGSCKLCGEVTHLIKDCPRKGNKDFTAAGLGNGSGDHQKVWQGNLTVFRSGDDLEDDFPPEEGTTAKKPRLSDSQSGLVSSGAENNNNSANVKIKKRKALKIVNFLG